MDTHPKNAPICYVQPTPEMGIRVSQFVDCNGKIYLPYLHEWTQAGSDLTTLVQVMILTFGDMPPVFKKAAPTTAPIAQHPDVAAGGYKPYDMRQLYPGGNNVGVPATYLPYPSSGGGGQQPVAANFPPYPMAASGGGYSHPMPGQAGTSGLPYPSGGVAMPGNGYVSVRSNATDIRQSVRVQP